MTNTKEADARISANQIANMQFYQPLGFYHDDDPEHYPEGAENDWPERVVVVDGVAGYVACPDCRAPERITDAELVASDFGGSHEWAIENGVPADCILCKDTGKVWVGL